MPFKKYGPIRICIAFNHQKLCHLEKSQEKFGRTLDLKTDEMKSFDLRELLLV